MMTERMKTVCSFLPSCRHFADVGCDHGYMAKYMLSHGLCARAYISDISVMSLQKAQLLLSEEIADGRCIPVVADGMKGLPKDIDCLLIAGLGGEQIVRILKEGYLPERFVLQPMKNTDKVRAYLREKDAKIDTDFTFGAGYYYDLIAGQNSGGNGYTEQDVLWGRDNLRFPNEPFFKKLRRERLNICCYLSRGGMSEESREALLKRRSAIDEVLHDC